MKVIMIIRKMNTNFGDRLFVKKKKHLRRLRNNDCLLFLFIYQCSLPPADLISMLLSFSKKTTHRKMAILDYSLS